MGTDVPSNLKINPSQSKILNVRYQNSVPVKRSVLGDNNTFHVRKLELETKKDVDSGLAQLMIKEKLRVEEEMRNKSWKRKKGQKPKPALSSYKISDKAI